METLKIIKEFVFILAPIATIILAIIGFNNWKKEYFGRTRLDSAYKVLKSIYGLRDSFKHLRQSLITVDEMLPRSDFSSKYHSDNEKYVLKNRLKYFSKFSNEFNSVMPEIEAVFGKNMKRTCSKINKILFKYQLSLNEYVQIIGKSVDGEYNKEVRTDIYQTKSENDLQIELEKYIEEIEKEISRNV